MDYRFVGNSELKVSQIALGGNNFGWRIDEKTSVDIINLAFEAGINFIDTADMYGQGRSEEFIGKAIAGKRSNVIIATKFGHPSTLSPGEHAASRSHILKAVEASLSRLNTDYIDLYYVHYYDPETPLYETLTTMDQLVREGKVRYIACSNFAAWQLCDAVWTSKSNNLKQFVAVQSRYNLLDRSIEAEMVPCCQNFGIAIIPWGPLASGFLTGKYHRGNEIPASMRLANPPAIYSDIITNANFDKLSKLDIFTRERDHGIGELAIAWLLSHSWLPSVIAGSMNTEQLSANIAASNWKLTQADIKEIDDILQPVS